MSDEQLALPMDIAVALAERLNAHRLRVIPNVYGDAQKAADVWLNGQLWGNPIIMCGKIHVYGLYLRDWSSVMVEFTNKHIMVIKPPPAAPSPSHSDEVQK